MSEGSVESWDVGVLRAFQEYSRRIGVFTLSFGSSGCVKRQIKWLA